MLDMFIKEPKPAEIQTAYEQYLERQVAREVDNDIFQSPLRKEKKE